MKRELFNKQKRKPIKTEYSFLSSSMVKEIAKFGGRIDHLVPENVSKDIYLYYQSKSENKE